MTSQTLAEAQWEESGRAWGARAAEWAYLWEPYARPANAVVFDQLGVTTGTRLVDIACGSGMAAQTAVGRGAVVSGLDAAEGLIAIAQARSPQADLQVGDMFALPFADGSFDVATSFNGIWKGCEGALREAHRVLVPGGRLGLTFWGAYERLGLMPYFLKVIELSPPSHGAATMEQGDTGRAGVVEHVLDATGFRVLDRGVVTVTNEWADVETACRALAAAGPSVPAIEGVGRGRFIDALRDVIEPLEVPGIGVRIDNEFVWVTAERV